MFFASQISDEETLENRLLFTPASRQNKPICRHAECIHWSPDLYVAAWMAPTPRTRTPPQELVSRNTFLQRGLPQFAFAAFTAPKSSSLLCNPESICPVHNGQYSNH
jgi:hypothetical protein